MPRYLYFIKMMPFSIFLSVPKGVSCGDTGLMVVSIEATDCTTGVGSTAAGGDDT